MPNLNHQQRNWFPDYPSTGEDITLAVSFVKDFPSSTLESIIPDNNDDETLLSPKDLCDPPGGLNYTGLHGIISLREVIGIGELMSRVTSVILGISHNLSLLASATLPIHRPHGSTVRIPGEMEHASTTRILFAISHGQDSNSKGFPRYCSREEISNSSMAGR